MSCATNASCPVMCRMCADAKAAQGCQQSADAALGRDALISLLLSLSLARSLARSRLRGPSFACIYDRVKLRVSKRSDRAGSPCDSAETLREPGVGFPRPHPAREICRRVCRSSRAGVWLGGGIAIDARVSTMPVCLQDASAGAGAGVSMRSVLVPVCSIMTIADNTETA